MDNQIQSILDSAMAPQSAQQTTTPSSDPITAILDQAGISMPSDQTQQAPTQQDTSDPWGQFGKQARDIVASRGLSPAVSKVLLAQAAIESARGTAAPGNNYFGIKGSGNAGSNNLATQEYGNGGYYNENSGFAAYNSSADSINAYLDLIMGYRGVPEAIQTGNPDAIIRAIEANGYATSPTYVRDVENTPEFNQ